MDLKKAIIHFSKGLSSNGRKAKATPKRAKKRMPGHLIKGWSGEA